MSVRALESNTKSAMPLVSAVNAGILRRQSHAPDFAARNPVPGDVHSVLRSGGEALDSSTRAFMQTGFRHDFSRVRVHTDARAAQSADVLHARAYTVGRDVVFARGAFAPHSHEGRGLIAHELTHVMQNEAQPQGPSSLKQVSAPDDASEREARAASHRILNGDGAGVAARPAGVVQRDDVATGIGIGAGVVGAGLLGLGIAALAGAFDGENFTSEELEKYLDKLEKSEQPEGARNSDNKARAVVRRWKAGDAKFSVLTIPVRVLLIQEMKTGYLGSDDQKAILDLLLDCIPSELAYILPRIGAEELRARFDGDNKKKLDGLIEGQEMEGLGGGAKWTVAGVKQIVRRHGDEKTLQLIADQGIKVLRFPKAIQTWKYPDGHTEDEETTTLQGMREGSIIHVRDTLPNERAAKTLFHELTHYTSKIADDDEQEIQVRIDTEKFLIRHGLPPAEKGYRTKEGKIDQAAIRKGVTGSEEYNPSGRERQGIKFEGETEEVGWD